MPSFTLILFCFARASLFYRAVSLQLTPNFNNYLGTTQRNSRATEYTVAIIGN